MQFPPHAQPQMYDPQMVAAGWNGHQVLQGRRRPASRPPGRPPAQGLRGPAPQGGHGAALSGTGWKCSHCTYLNTSNLRILDPQTKQHKGFCEICEGVTTLWR